jgi:hypothetical protein
VEIITYIKNLPADPLSTEMIQTADRHIPLCALTACHFDSLKLCGKISLCSSVNVSTSCSNAPYQLLYWPDGFNWIQQHNSYAHRNHTPCALSLGSFSSSCLALMASPLLSRTPNSTGRWMAIELAFKQKESICLLYISYTRRLSRSTKVLFLRSHLIAV